MDKIKEFYKKWEHLGGPIFFVGGFALDILTLGRVDEATNFVVFLF